uniref:Putative cytoplasmic protein n=1 Tax=Siphoviridae sp. ctzAk96 TaxID=2826527 RepID=A0A8S5QW05_9CAUD|nr:MAG TPA: putative cytoplasmic protein [Siphoviridae sp. ctzAk96]
MAVLFSGACHDEHGNCYQGGRAGDQTGTEVRTTRAYNCKGGWLIFRHPNSNVAYWIGTNARVMADNNNFGYDQWERLTGYNKAKAAGWEPAKVTTPCELDCSSMVRTAIACALERDIPNFNTASEPSVLLSLGFQEITGTPLDQLHKGDIVCTKTQGHTEICSQGIETVASATTPTTTKGSMKYCVIAGEKAYDEVTDLTDYAGVIGKAITDVAIRATNGNILYRVHVKGGGWLAWVSGYNWYDAINGYAGNGEEIDGLQVKPNGVNCNIKTRVHIKGGGWLAWVINDTDYAGWYGKAIDAIQVVQA